MKTPKEKATELFEKCYRVKDNDGYFSSNIVRAVRNAQIAVELKIEGLPSINNTAPIKRLEDDCYFQYWVSVHLELEKINK